MSNATPTRTAGSNVLVIDAGTAGLRAAIAARGADDQRGTAVR